MLMPTLSVTAIGIVIGLSLGLFRGRPAASLLSGVAGAWIGFLLGAVTGGMFDVVTRSGEGVLVAGHLAAAVGAVLAVSRSRLFTA